MAFIEINRGRGDILAGRMQGFVMEHVEFEIPTRHDCPPCGSLNGDLDCQWEAGLRHTFRSCQCKDGSR